MLFATCAVRAQPAGDPQVAFCSGTWHVRTLVLTIPLATRRLPLTLSSMITTLAVELPYFTSGVSLLPM